MWDHLLFSLFHSYGLNSGHFQPPVPTTHVDICHFWEGGVVPLIIFFVSLPSIIILEYISCLYIVNTLYLHRPDTKPPSIVSTIHKLQNEELIVN